MNVKLTHEELHKHLVEQLEEIRCLCDAYDNGGYIVYKSISIKLRVLFHHTNRSNSLLNQLHMDKEMTSTSGKKIEGNLFKNFYGLVHIIVKPEAKSIFGHGKLIPIKEKVNLKYWWEEEVVLTDSNGIDFTRKNIILAISNKDGGGHVDPYVASEYYNLKSGEASGVVFNRDGTSYTFNPLIASIRQIAEEVLLSFNDDYLVVIKNLKKR
ncbi:hypothetical protein [Sphingobacterium cavernae]|uniref:hypothetical protein n=1 Tax=Sphingobacterium cavernae TaxID=2592657 RepID=UPI00123006F3|nr:hypothetical protein [Sphingobacterium cavernae]